MPVEPAEVPAPAQAPRSTKQPPRIDRCAKVLDFEAARRERQLTQQEAADELGVCRTTLIGWVARAADAGLTPAQRAFFEVTVHGGGPALRFARSRRHT